MIDKLFRNRSATKARHAGDRAREARRWHGAAAHYERYLSFAPGDFAIRVQLGHAYTELRDFAAADRAYAAAAAITPDDADLLLCWAHSRKDAGDTAQARDLYTRSFAIGGNPEARHQAELLERAAEAEAQALEVALEPPAPPPPTGKIEWADGLAVWGHVTGAGEAVEFREEGRPVGRARLHPAREDGTRPFRTMLGLDHDAIVTAHLLPDGGELEGSPFGIGPPPRHRDDRPRAWDARIETAKPFVMPEHDEVALFVTHSRTGALKPHVLPYLHALKAEGIAVLLIAVVDRELNLRPEVLDAVAGALVRENAGYDFGAWAHAIHLHPEVYGAATLYLLNDSVIGPADTGRFARLIARVRASDGDLIGLTESHEYRWHVQTFFLALKPRLLSATQLQRFMADVRLLPDKDAVIHAYELGFAQAMERAGYRVDVLFPSTVAFNPTLFGWRRLLADGFPFMKLLLLRGAFPQLDTDGWRETLAGAGFDLALIDDTVRACAEEVPHDGSAHLLAHPAPWRPREGEPLKVAFYGPWNYDNGLGAAARGIIGAIRRSGVRLNLHPIKQPFHVHRPLAPPVDVVDFAGPADIAVVHLNPDSWFLLTEEQRAEIYRTPARIGYWVWEMGHIPPAWRQDFSSVHRIWAPSRYCADLFAAEDEAPVDVIPHAVPVLPPVTIDRARLLGDLGLPAERRIILYLFDSSSYLVRKNPAALVRAFAASGLGARGWTLVLKTKHLMDRPDDGARFRALAEGTEDVLLIDRALAADELRDLMALADIYASPHCAEGFGLTIAEAMAAGKPVVATDFGGSADYLDSATGYPVKARPWRLDRDYGHYTAGGEWARVDEPALAATLLRAADAVEAGDDSIGRAARRRIAERLSYEAVGARIAESFRRIFTARGGAPRVERIEPGLLAGVPFAEADLGPDMVAAPLEPDGSVGTDTLAAIAGWPADRDRWIAFAPADGLVTPLFAQRVADHARARPDAAIFYGDDLAVGAERAIDQLRLKPEFDVTLLAAQDYVGAPLIVRASALAALGGVRPEARTAAMADLLFRAHAAGQSIARIPEVLLATRGDRAAPDPDDYRAMLEAQPPLAPYAVVAGRVAGSFALARRFTPETAPPVTILIPTRQAMLADGSGSHVARLLDGIATADWPMDRLTVLVGDDIPGEPDWARADRPFALRRIETPRAPGEPFNYAAKMNRLWRSAETEQILFLNDDVRPLDGGWLKALETFAVDESVGGVGARLLFEDGSLQHAGMAPHGDGLVHVSVFRERREGTYRDWTLVQREWSMVTGAVFATRRSLMEQVAGFDERFSLEFNDIDLCLRLRALGYRIVCTPMAEMIHAEKASRGERPPPGDDLALFLSRWKPWIDHDPAWHPYLRRDRIDITPMPEPHAWYR